MNEAGDVYTHSLCLKHLLKSKRDKLLPAERDKVEFLKVDKPFFMHIFGSK